MHRNLAIELESITNRHIDKQVQRYRSEVVPSVLVAYPQEFLNQKDTHDVTLSPDRNADIPNVRKLSVEMPNITTPLIRKIRTQDEDCTYGMILS